MEPYMGQILLLSFDWAPQGFFQCNGQLLPISSYQALFSLLGTVYGGNGINNFALPNLQGRTPIGPNANYPLGNVGGVESYALNVANVPSHTHIVNASTTVDKEIPTNNLLGGGGETMYGPPTTLGAMNSAVVGMAGGSQPHENRQPYLCMNWVIAYNGIYPSRP
jgi:microcystin-dependent protein